MLQSTPAAMKKVPKFQTPKIVGVVLRRQLSERVRSLSEYWHSLGIRWPFAESAVTQQMICSALAQHSLSKWLPLLIVHWLRWRVFEALNVDVRG